MAQQMRSALTAALDHGGGKSLRRVLRTDAGNMVGMQTEMAPRQIAIHGKVQVVIDPRGNDLPTRATRRQGRR